MTADALLLWMSARGTGSWQQFRAAVEELHVTGGDVADEDDDQPADQSALPLYQELRLNLQRLGHAEFFAGAGETEWRVTPPSLAVTQTAHGWLGILAGARTNDVLQRVQAACTAIGVRKLSNPACPEQFLFGASSERELCDLAENAGLLLQRDAPAALLAALPPVDDQSARKSLPFPFGADWKVDEFRPRDLKWHASTLGDARAAYRKLYRFSHGYQRYVLFCVNGKSFQIPGQVGKYLALRRSRRAILQYDRAASALSLPASCRPPFLIERALILCSGLIPAFNLGMLRYIDIPHRIALTVSGLLRQELR